MWNRLTHSSILNEHLIISGIFLIICHFSLGFRFDEAQKNIYDYGGDISKMQMGTPDHTYCENVYQEPNVTRLTPDSTYGL